MSSQDQDQPNLQVRPYGSKLTYFSTIAELAKSNKPSEQVVLEMLDLFHTRLSRTRPTQENIEWIIELIAQEKERVHYHTDNMRTN